MKVDLPDGVSPRIGFACRSSSTEDDTVFLDGHNTPTKKFIDTTTRQCYVCFHTVVTGFSTPDKKIVRQNSIQQLHEQQKIWMPLLIL